MPSLMFCSLTKSFPDIGASSVAFVALLVRCDICRWRIGYRARCSSVDSMRLNFSYVLPLDRTKEAWTPEMVVSSSSLLNRHCRPSLTAGTLPACASLTNVLGWILKNLAASLALRTSVVDSQLARWLLHGS